MKTKHIEEVDLYFWTKTGNYKSKKYRHYDCRYM